jgi:CheY-like chemotaxis protein
MPNPPIGLPKFRVMVVDDDPDVRSSIEAVLSEAFEVRTCENAMQALAVLAREDFHVICSDWQMPGMDGVEFFRRILAQPAWDAATCILVTGQFEELLKEVAWADRKRLGIVRKPFSPRAFMERVEQYANLSEMKRSIRRLHAIAGREDGSGGPT